jgi:RND superfamily putative drug exporter
VIRLGVWLVLRLRLLVVVGWVAAAVAAHVYLPGLTGADEAELGGLVPRTSHAARVEARSFEHFRVPLLARAVVVQRNPDGLTRAEQERAVRRAVRVSRGEEPLLRTIVFALPILNSGRVVPSSSEEGTTAITYLFFDQNASLGARAALSDTYASQVARAGDHLVGVTGAAPARIAQWHAIEDALPLIEIATVLLIALVVGITFRSPGAPLLALAAAGISYMVGIGVVGWTGDALGLEVPREVQPVMLVLILGLVTDYSVFYLSGVRRSLAAGEGRVAAAEDAARLYTPIMLTTGLIVVFGTASLLLGRLEFFRAFGPGAALSALVSLVVSLTFLPAALAVFGRLVFWPSLATTEHAPSDERRRLGRRLAFLGTARPAAFVVAAVAFAALVVCALPLRDGNLGFTLLTGFREGSSVERALEAAARGFEPGIVAPTMILVEGDGVGTRRPALDRLERALAREPGVAGVIGPSAQPERLEKDVFLADDAARYAVVLDSEPLGAAAIDEVRGLQERLPSLVRKSGLGDATVGVAGDTALAGETIDSMLADIARIGLAALAVNFLFLAVFLRSLVGPVFLVAASVLGLAASLGATVFVFQGLLGHGDLTYYVPFAAAVLLLSLGSDYNLFVVGRIWQEARDAPLRDAIADAAPRASRAIAVAGVALAGSFALLALVPLRPFREFAFVMAFGILVDTFLVRTLLVPALIALVGDAGFWPGRRGGAQPAAR